MGYSPWGHKELDTTETNTFTFRNQYNIVKKTILQQKVKKKKRKKESAKKAPIMGMSRAQESIETAPNGRSCNNLSKKIR